MEIKLESGLNGMKMAILNDNKKDGLVVEYYPLINIISREYYLVDGEVKGRGFWSDMDL